MKKIQYIFIISIMALFFAGCQNPVQPPEPEPEPKSLSLLADYFTEIKSVKKETAPFYSEDETTQDTLDCYYVNDEKCIPYLDADGIKKLLSKTTSLENINYSLTVKKYEKGFSLTRENGAYAYFDSTDNTISVDDFLMFIANPDAENGLDTVYLNSKNGKNPEKLIWHQTFFHRKGKSIQFNLSKYKISFIVSGSEILIPAQVVIDLFNSALVLYNENGFFLISSSSLSDNQNEPKDIVKKYRNVKKEKRSEALKQFTYNELCLSLDYNYGLKKEHNIESFDKLFIESGLISELFDDDAAKVCSALYKLTNIYFADKHSAANVASPKSLTEYEPDFSLTMNIMLERANLFQMYVSARNKYYPEGIKGYEEVGDTAFITFDNFLYDLNINYSDTTLTNTIDDTLILIMYANQQIRRKNSPIKKVVLDLSNNTGGYVDTAVAVLSWMIKICNLQLKSDLTDDFATMAYVFDTNRNFNLFDDEENYSDDISDLKLFCLTSPVSFSCGNLVPAMLKESGKVTLLGRKSGGGTCFVKFMSTPDGTVFQISSQYKLSILKNGVAYHIDEGVEPHFYISDINHFYDRKWLVNYLDNLL